MCLVITPTLYNPPPDKLVVDMLVVDMLAVDMLVVDMLVVDMLVVDMLVVDMSNESFKIQNTSSFHY